MKYQIEISTIYLIPCFVLFIIFIHYLSLMEFYYKNKDKLNEPECYDDLEKEKDKAYREFRFQKRLYGTMSQEDIDKVNNSSKEYELEEQNNFNAYFYETRIKNKDGSISAIKFEGGKQVEN